MKHWSGRVAFAVMLLGSMHATVGRGAVIGLGMAGAAKNEVDKLNARVVAAEVVTAPRTPDGPASGLAGANLSYTYTTGGAVSNQKHPVEYRFNWGNGTVSAWGSVTTATYAWPAAGSYLVTAEARCQRHLAVIAVSAPLAVTVSVETLSTPSTPSGVASGYAGVSYTYTAGGSVSSLGHPTEYRFDWGDGAFSSWGPAVSATHTWPAGGTYSVTLQARCTTHPTVTTVSLPLAVTISVETVSAPITPSGSSSAAVSATCMFTTGGAVSNFSHPVEYRVIWGDGTASPWGSTTVFSHSWTDPGIYSVVAQARCQLHPPIIGTSAPATVTITVPPGTIRTFAGTGVTGNYGENVAATSAQLNTPSAVALDGTGNVYVADRGNEIVRKIVTATGLISTVAGDGSSGFYGDGGPATNANLWNPMGVASDTAGNLYIADRYNNRIRRVSASTGLITTVAGNDTGTLADGIPATAAQLPAPVAASLDAAGNYYIADTTYHAVRKVIASSGLIYTVAGGVGGIPGYNGDSQPATDAKVFNPSGMASDAAGNLFIADTSNHRIRKVTASTGLITTVAGTGVAGYNGDSQPATNAQVSGPKGVAVDGAGNLYIADTSNHRIRKVTAGTGQITTLAGTGTAGYNGDNQPGTNAQVNAPCWVVVDAAGNLYIADTGNARIRKVFP